MGKKSTNRKRAIRQYMREHGVKHTKAARVVDAQLASTLSTAGETGVGGREGHQFRLFSFTSDRVFYDPMTEFGPAPLVKTTTWRDLLSEALHRIARPHSRAMHPIRARVARPADEWGTRALAALRQLGNSTAITVTEADDVDEVQVTLTVRSPHFANSAMLADLTTAQTQRVEATQSVESRSADFRSGSEALARAAGGQGALLDPSRDEELARIIEQGKSMSMEAAACWDHLAHQGWDTLSLTEFGSLTTPWWVGLNEPPRERADLSVTVELMRLMDDGPDEDFGFGLTEVADVLGFMQERLERGQDRPEALVSLRHPARVVMDPLVSSAVEVLTQRLSQRGRQAGMGVNFLAQAGGHGSNSKGLLEVTKR